MLGGGRQGLGATPAIYTVASLEAGGAVSSVANVGGGVFITGTRNGELSFPSRVGQEIFGSRGGAADGGEAAARAVKEAQAAAGEVVGSQDYWGNTLAVHRVQVVGGDPAAVAPGGGEQQPQLVVRLAGACEHVGDATALCVIADRTGDGFARFLSASSSGCVSMFRLWEGGGGMEQGGEDGVSYDPELSSETKAHSERVTGMAVNGTTASSVCEGGEVAALDLSTMQVAWSAICPDGLPQTSVAFKGSSEQEFATAGASPRAQLKLWDRRAGCKPVSILRHPIQDAPDACYNCLANKPSSPDVFAAGTETGEVMMWDLRGSRTGVLSTLKMKAGPGEGQGRSQDREQSKPQPSEYMHSKDVWAVAFHPQRPRYLFSCGEDGRQILWDYSQDTATAVPGGLDRSPRVDVAVGRQLWELESGLVGLCYDSPDNLLVAVSKHGQATVTKDLAELWV